MKRQFGVALGILIVSTWSGLAGGEEMHTCALLTSGEVVAAVGGTGQSQETNIVLPEGPSKGETLSGCMWTADNQGMVSISMIRAPQGALREAGLAKLREGFQRLKAKGWTEEKRSSATPNARS